MRGALQLLLTFALVVTSAIGRASENISYGYDPLGRLVTVAHTRSVNNGTSSSFQYDPAGNRTQVVVAGVQPPSSPSGMTVIGSNVTISGNNVLPNGSQADWVEGFKSSATFTGGLTATASTSGNSARWAIGISDASEAVGSFFDVDYMIMAHDSDHKVSSWQNGAGTGVVADWSSASPATVKITYQGSTLTASVNGTVVRTWATTPGRTFRVYGFFNHQSTGPMQGVSVAP